MNRLKALRYDAGLTQSEIAKRANITTTNYQRIEYGKQMPRVNIAMAIAKVLNCKVEDIF